MFPDSLGRTVSGMTPYASDSGHRQMPMECFQEFTPYPCHRSHLATAIWHPASASASECCKVLDEDQIPVSDPTGSPPP